MSSVAPAPRADDAAPGADSAARRGPSVLRPPALVALALVLAGLAWTFGTPPGGAPDELTHYLKALGVAGGQLAGDPPDPAWVPPYVETGGAAAAHGAPADPGQRARLRWVRSQARTFSIPAALDVDTTCDARGPTRAGCLSRLRPPRPQDRVTTAMGTYQPLTYVLPGLAARVAHDPATAIRLGRLASAAFCLALLALAGAAAWGQGGRAGALAGLGVLAAVSPAVLFVATTINSSGPEVAGAIAFTAGMLAVTRPGGRSAVAWLAVGLGGVTLGGAKSFGPLFVLFTLLAVGALAGRPGLQAAVARPRGGAVVAGAATAVSAALGWVWEFTRQPHAGVRASDVRPGLEDGIHNLSFLAKQGVGVFGRVLDVPMPTPAYAVWAALVLGVVGLAGRVADRRERAVLAAIAASALALVLALAVAVRPTGWGEQTRHVLAALVVLPLVAGEVLRRHAGALAARTAALAVVLAAGLAAAVHLTAWYVNARAWSSGPRGPAFLTAGDGWLPPGSWLPWAGAIVLAGVALVLAALATSVTERTQRPAAD